MRKIIIGFMMLLLFSTASVSVSMAEQKVGEYEGIEGFCCWEGCDNPRGDKGSYFCDTHGCADPNCGINNNSKYCYTCRDNAVTYRTEWDWTEWKIKGYFSFCNDNNYSKYCISHACRVQNCPNESSINALLNSSNCYIHQRVCKEDNCYYWCERIVNEGEFSKNQAGQYLYYNYCEKHRCEGVRDAGDKCGEVKTGMSKYCTRHTCVIGFCGNQKEEDAKACSLHTCAAKNCTKSIHCLQHDDGGKPYSECWKSHLNEANPTSGVSKFCKEHYEIALGSKMPYKADDKVGNKTNDEYKTPDQQNDIENTIKGALEDQKNYNHLHPGQQFLPNNNPSMMNPEKPPIENAVDNLDKTFGDRCGKCNELLISCTTCGGKYCSACDKKCQQNHVDDSLTSVSYKDLPNVSDFIRDEKIDEVEKALEESQVMSTTYKILLKVGISITMIIILLMGVKWIMAAPQQRAELKQSFIPLIIGVFLLFCGASIGETVISYMDSVFSHDNMSNAIAEAESGVSYIIYTVGISLALIMILVNGIMWLVATPQKRAELKGRMWNMVIGIGLLIGATFILSFLGTFFENINI